MKNHIFQFISKYFKILTGNMPLRIEGINDYKDYWDSDKISSNKITTKYMNNRLNLIAEEITPQSTVLDIGCGDGSLLEIISQKQECTLEGVDISEHAVELTKKRGFNARTLDLSKDPIENLPVYDHIILAEVIEHLADPEQMLLSLKNKFNKSIIITTPNIAFLLYRLRLGIFGKFPNTTGFRHIRMHLSFWSVKDFAYWAKFLGFKVTKLTAVGGVNFLSLNKLLPNIFGGHIFAVLEKEDF